ncbi:MAG: hypothetical protein IKN18_06450 [Neisseriaceae bacterium]|nr:hypothetical protein [Neisseriaceae bacterium]
MNNTRFLFTAFAFLVAIPAMAKDPVISSNTSGISDDKLINSVAAASIGSGVKEPLKISGNANQLSISGSNKTVCTVPLANGKMKGISCK